ncbi:chemotaxis protein CheA [Gottfriedia solisilvae]|uniref:Chemotaxis protein CheA n=1 Tax=Gottfriedia solisilvae TaxID=1516104 RepID=A0A8J3AJZ0_9BACI|nr:chemotaxis protein CheA [Gottfriedia solisilvae]GGI14184.1 chemotaxis protein CheA [Gottfriedia solisilvae]
MELNQYLDLFIDESREHLQNINENLLELEKEPTNLAIVNEIFRSAHTLKGMSATMGYEDLANLTHQMENVLDAIRNNKISVSSSILDVVFQSIDDLEAMVESISTGGDGKRDVKEIVLKLAAIEKGTEFVEETNEVKNESDQLTLRYDEYDYTVIEQSVDQGFNVFEIKVELTASCILKAARSFMVFESLEQNGEILKSNPSVDKLETEQFDAVFYVTFITKIDNSEVKNVIMKISEIHNVEITSFDLNRIKQENEQKEVMNEIAAAKKEVAVTVAPENEQKNKATAQSNSKTIRVNIERLDILMNLFEELVIDRGRLEQISRDLSHGELQETVERMTRVSSDLQSIILNMRMVPIDTVFNRFPRMVRQLSKDLNKKIDLQIIGAETELDRTVIDEIGDPLVHLIRNALDHGIEKPEVRVSKGKPETGTVELKAFHSGNHVFIEVKEDGAGISREKVLEKAIKNKIVTEQQASTLTDKQVFELIFASGFSTAEVLSDISGRGVGLDVVKSKIESLGGTVSVDSILGHGTTFSVQLPLTLSIISVMLVELQKEKYAIPLSSIIETAFIKKTDIMSAHNQKVIDFRGKVVPLLFLNDLFNVPVESENNTDGISVVIVRKGDKLAGLVVDSFIGQQEIVLKSLGNYLTNVFAISGATILGDGQVALILDCNALIK